MVLHDCKWVVEMSAALWIYRHLSAYECERVRKKKKICAYQYKAEGIIAVKKKIIKKILYVVFRFAKGLSTATAAPLRCQFECKIFVFISRSHSKVHWEFFSFTGDKISLSIFLGVNCWSRLW